MEFNGIMAGELVTYLKELCPKFGIIHKTEVIKKEGTVEGYLVWDYILWNEISYISADGQNIQRLFNSTSDEKTEKEFQKLILQFTLN